MIIWKKRDILCSKIGDQIFWRGAKYHKQKLVLKEEMSSTRLSDFRREVKVHIELD